MTIVTEALTELEPVIKTTFTVEEIRQLLPHRYPFALVDRIIDYVPGQKAVRPKKCHDQRAFFSRSYSQSSLDAGGVNC